MAERRSFGQALKGYRKALGLTQKELAHTAGCAVVTLRKLEADSLRCSLPLAQRLAMALGLSAEEQPAFLQSARIAGHAARAALPIPPTTWVGRSADLGAVAALLEKPGVRLLTLTGPPGVGKTRLALHVAAALEERYTDGVACVALADLDDSQRVVSAIAQACGVAERNGQTLPERLKRALHARHMLLVLDNFEHLRPAAPLLVELLEAIPGLRLLVTSRAALRVSGEYEYEVQPLPVPPPEPAPTPADLLPIPSVELLVERGQAVRATFRLTGQNAAAIAELCRRLDGLPLALELAAARLKLLTPQQLLDQFEGSLALLTSGPQDLPPRQQTLRQAIAWSYALLDPAAQRLFRQLGVFVGGWSLAAAQAVVEAAYSALSLLHAVTILLDQSLVQRQDTPDGSPHFTMLETLRHYALEQLASHAETETAARRHASYYLSLAEEAAPQLRLAAGVAHLDTLQHEHANLRAALRWSLGNDHVLGLRLATAIYRFWSIRGYQTEGQEWLRLLLAHDEQAGGTAPAAVRMAALEAAGSLAWMRGDHQQAEAWCLAAQTIAEAEGDHGREAHMLNLRGNIAGYRGNYHDARSYYQQALQINRTCGNANGISVNLQNLAYLGLAMNETAEVEAQATESLHRCRFANDQQGVATSLVCLGWLAATRANLPQAQVYLDQALDMHRTRGDRYLLADTLRIAGMLAYRRGDLSRTQQLWTEGLALFLEIDNPEGVASCLELLGLLLVNLNQASLAARLWAAAATWRAGSGVPAPQVTQAELQHGLQLAQAALGAEPFATAWASGQALALDEAAALVMNLAYRNAPP